MSLVYTLIARGNKIILVDYTEYSGNFQQISLVILNKVKKEKRCSIDYNDFNFHYEDENDVTYMCISRDMKEEVVFSFLSDVKKKFLKKYDLKTISNSFAYQLREFSDDLRGLVKFYEENPTHTKTGILLNNLNETTEILRESVEKLLERNEKINIIAQKSKNLRNTSNDMRLLATEIRKKERRGYFKYVLMLLVLLLILAIILYFVLRK